MAVEVPKIAVPDFWLASFPGVQEHLATRGRTGRVQGIGR